MGLPAFTISALNAAQAPVSAPPRASTTIFLPATNRQRLSQEEQERQIRADVDRFVKGTNEWRIKTLVDFVTLGQVLEGALIHATFDVLWEYLKSHQKRAADLRKLASDYDSSDDGLLATLNGSIAEAALYSRDAARFLRRQHKRLAAAFKMRAMTFDRLIKRFDDIELSIREGLKKKHRFLGEILPRATETFGSDGKAMNWLLKPSQALAHRSPIDVLEEDNGLARVNDLLNRIDHGLAA